MRDAAALHSFGGGRQSGRWSNDLLDSLRRTMDPPADSVVADFFHRTPEHRPHDLFIALLEHRAGRENSQLVEIPSELLRALDERDPVPLPPDLDLRPAQALFRDHGPEILMLLGSYSLPMSYAAANGAEVLAQTGYLEKRVMRRVVETAQLVIDVLKPGGLEPGGDGVRSAREVRLVHAAIRHLIEEEGTWDVQTLGDPINQEDLLGTLMVFSAVVLDGLEKLGIKVNQATQESFLATWCYVGRLFGISAQLLPRSSDEARELTWKIYDRQMRKSDVGPQLMQALLSSMRDNMPFAIARALPPSVIRFFMLPMAADLLGVPRRPIIDVIVAAGLKCFALLHNLLEALPGGASIERWFSRRVVQALIAAGRADSHCTAFEIPLDLHAEWQIPGPHDALH